MASNSTNTLSMGQRLIDTSNLAGQLHTDLVNEHAKIQALDCIAHQSQSKHTVTQSSHEYNSLTTLFKQTLPLFSQDLEARRSEMRDLKQDDPLNPLTLEWDSQLKQIKQFIRNQTNGFIDTLRPFVCTTEFGITAIDDLCIKKNATQLSTPPRPSSAPAILSPPPALSTSTSSSSSSDSSSSSSDSSSQSSGKGGSSQLSSVPLNSAEQSTALFDTTAVFESPTVKQSSSSSSSSDSSSSSSSARPIQVKASSGKPRDKSTSSSSSSDTKISGLKPFQTVPSSSSSSGSSKNPVVVASVLEETTAEFQTQTSSSSSTVHPSLPSPSTNSNVLADTSDAFAQSITPPVTLEEPQEPTDVIRSKIEENFDALLALSTEPISSAEPTSIEDSASFVSTNPFAGSFFDPELPSDFPTSFDFLPAAAPSLPSEFSRAAEEPITTSSDSFLIREPKKSKLSKKDRKALRRTEKQSKNDARRPAVSEMMFVPPSSSTRSTFNVPSALPADPSLFEENDAFLSFSSYSPQALTADFLSQRSPVHRSIHASSWPVVDGKPVADFGFGTEGVVQQEASGSDEPVDSTTDFGNFAYAFEEHESEQAVYSDFNAPVAETMGSEGEEEVTTAPQGPKKFSSKYNAYKTTIISLISTATTLKDKELKKQVEALPRTLYNAFYETVAQMRGKAELSEKEMRAYGKKTYVKNKEFAVAAFAVLSSRFKG